MRPRLALLLVCVLSVLAGATTLAAPALGARDHRSTSTTTTTSTTSTRGTSTRAGRTHRARHRRTHTVHTVPGSSHAAAEQVLHECQSHGQLTTSFSRADLKEALAIEGASVQQYSDCSDVIQNALTHGIKASDVNGSGGGSSTTTIVIIVVVVLLLLAAILGGLAVRRRRGGGGDGDGGVDAPAGPA